MMGQTYDKIEGAIHQHQSLAKPTLTNLSQDSKSIEKNLHPYNYPCSQVVTVKHGYLYSILSFLCIVFKVYSPLGCVRPQKAVRSTNEGGIHKKPLDRSLRPIRTHSVTNDSNSPIMCSYFFTIDYDYLEQFETKKKHRKFVLGRKLSLFWQSLLKL